MEIIITLLSSLSLNYPVFRCFTVVRHEVFFCCPTNLDSGDLQILVIYYMAAEIPYNLASFLILYCFIFFNFWFPRLVAVVFVIQSNNNLAWYFLVSLWLSTNISFILTNYNVQVLQLGSLLIKSKSDLDSLTLNIEEQSSSLKHLLNSACSEDFTMGFRLQDLYNHFEVKLNDFEVRIVFLVCILGSIFTI